MSNDYKPQKNKFLQIFLPEENTPRLKYLGSLSSLALLVRDMDCDKNVLTHDLTNSDLGMVISMIRKDVILNYYPQDQSPLSVKVYSLSISDKVTSGTKKLNIIIPLEREVQIYNMASMYIPNFIWKEISLTIPLNDVHEEELLSFIQRLCFCQSNPMTDKKKTPKIQFLIETEDFNLEELETKYQNIFGKIKVSKAGQLYSIYSASLKADLKKEWSKNDDFRDFKFSFIVKDNKYILNGEQLCFHSDVSLSFDTEKKLPMTPDYTAKILNTKTVKEPPKAKKTTITHFAGDYNPRVREPLKNVSRELIESLKGARPKLSPFEFSTVMEEPSFISSEIKMP